MSGAVFSAVLTPGNRVVGRGVIANRPAASAFLYDREYISTDEGGGDQRYWCDGTTWHQSGPGASEYDPVTTTWALRGSGVAVGDTKVISDLGNNPAVEAIWDGTYWQPRGGRQQLYNLKAPVAGASSATPSVSLVTVSIPGGLMNINGGIAFEALVNLDGDPLTATDTLTFGGSNIMSNTASGTSERRYFGRQVRNLNSASAQAVDNRASGAEYGTFGVGATQITTLALNTANTLDLAGSVAYTSSVAQIATLYIQRVWWIRG